ncbi:MAG: DUF1822 family protein, partial [Calothrix sp. SM1_7_51]|nr:DUF1822 family protein [Calothrix sp. SM1_7_51]
MMLSINELLEIHPEHLWLEFSQEDQSIAYSNSNTCWNAYLNSLCSNSFLAWLKEEPDFQTIPKALPELADLHSIWEFVNGTALTVGDNRIVLIPSDKSSLREVRIPQEWVDIPNWAAHYYLAVQLDLAKRWLRVWG